MINGTDIKRIKSLVATFVIASFSFAQTTIVFQVVEMRGEKYNAVTERILTSAKLQDYNSFENTREDKTGHV